MKVINLYGESFVKTCKDLATQINNSGEVFDVVVGIQTGGGYVAREVYKTLKEQSINATYVEVKIQRGSTRAKEVSHVKTILRKLPEFILNFLRILEVEFLELKAKFIKPVRHGEISFASEVGQLLSEGGKNILLIDDCIDTGYTIKAIKDYIEENFLNNKVKTAVVTIAHRKPIIKVDYKLFNRVLIRFPWANDAKEK